MEPPLLLAPGFPASHSRKIDTSADEFISLTIVKLPVSPSGRTDPVGCSLGSVDTKLLAYRVGDVASRGSESEALLVGNTGIGLDSFSDDSAVPRALLQDLQRLVAAGGKLQMVRNFPRRGERQPI